MNTEKSSPAEGTQKPGAPKAKRRKPLWWRILKWVLGIIIAVVLLIGGVLGVAVWILTPEKLTPLVEKTASKYLDADVNIGRLELTYWSTFPSLKLKLDTLELVSRSLKGITPEQRALLPADADTLLTLKGLKGSVNIPKLLLMKIELRDIVLDTPRANIVALNDSVTNYDIVPPSEDTDTTSTVPDITLNHFTLEGGLKARYFNAADTTDISIALSPSKFDAEKRPTYTLVTAGDAEVNIVGMTLPPVIDFSLDTKVVWEHKHPRKLGLEDTRIGLGPACVSLSTLLDFGDLLTVEKGQLSLEPISVTELIDWLPQSYTESIKGLKTDMTLSLEASLLKPYAIGGPAIPSATVRVNIPDCHLSYQQMVLSHVILDAGATIDGDDIHASKVQIGNLYLQGEGVGVKFEGEATDLFRDPLVTGNFKGGISFAKLPSQLQQMLPFTLQGLFEADADLRLRPSYLDRLNFHKINVDGTATLTNFRLKGTGSDSEIYTRKASLKFGSSSHVTLSDGATADSVLTASLTVDTVSYMMDSLSINGTRLQLGLGISNRAASVDTNTVVPLGFKVSAHRLRYTDLTDSSSIVTAEPSVYGAITRFKDSKRRPLIAAGVKSRFIRYRTSDARISLLEPSVNLRLHPNARPRMSKRVAQAFDSIQALHPSLRPDSILTLARHEAAAKRRLRKRTATPVREDSTEVLDLRADKETRSLLQWWDASGTVKAKRGRLITPYFPLRNTLSNVDIRFDMDSTVIKDTKFKAGRSDFLINGVISNYTNALTRKRAAMNIRFLITGDTLDINQLTDAAFIGAAYAEKASTDGKTLAIGEMQSDEGLQQAVSVTAADSVSGPLLVPMNLDATLDIRSNTALYDGLVMHNVRGAAMIHEGALSLRELTATTDAGSVSLHALYAAPVKTEMKLGMGLVLKNFYIQKFTKLFPTLDSIMPALNTLSGRINAEMAATTDIEPNMDINLASLSALLTVKGDSLTVIDPDTYKTISKWLLFKDKHHNMIDSISAQVAIERGSLEIYPFIFNFDRYKLGVMGHNDLAMNLNYHVSVLKSPIPFKFGINIKGTPEHMKIRLGGAKIKPNMAVEKVQLVTNTRINLIQEMDNAFARGVRRAKLRTLEPGLQGGQPAPSIPEQEDTVSSADSLFFIKEGLIQAPPPVQSTPK